MQEPRRWPSFRELAQEGYTLTQCRLEISSEDGVGKPQEAREWWLEKAL